MPAPKLSRSALPGALLCLLLGACGGSGATLAPSSAAPAPERPPAVLGEPVVRPERQPEPRREPEPSLQERWDAPFAVRSTGRLAPHSPRRVVVVRADSARVAEPDRAPPAASPPATRTAAPAPPPAPARTAPAAAPRSHEVERGDTWYGIARQYGVAPSALRVANPDVDPEKIRTGQTLRIPREGAGRESVRTHRVEQGDSLWGIARRYGVSIDALRAANRLQGDRVRIGQSIIIPEGGR